MKCTETLTVWFSPIKILIFGIKCTDIKHSFSGTMAKLHLHNTDGTRV